MDSGFQVHMIIVHLKFEEFEKYIKNTIFASATPSEYERKNSFQIVEQVVRPTGLLRSYSRSKTY